MTPFTQPISENIWDLKYRYKRGGKVMDKTIQATWRRVANAAARPEQKPDQKKWRDRFYQILENFQFLPGGRILAGAGTRHNVTLFNCFVMPIKDDSMISIFNGLKEGAITLQQGGGIGMDFSVLRPKGEYAQHTGTIASGPVSFMRIWDSMCATMQSTGARRGAMMGMLRCDHPDIEDFIQAKSDPKELRHFNVSVLVTDAFMQAVKHDKSWPLVFPETSPKTYKTVAATDLWHKIIRNAYDHAEPGVVFVDTINQQNNLHDHELIHATNPCGEIPLPDYGACNLGSINLTQVVQYAFSDKAEIDWKKLALISEYATRFLDNIIDISRYPLKPQKLMAQNTRRIGLGVSGLADALVMLNVEYGSEKALELTKRIMKTIATTTWETSIALASERGSFPLFKAENYIKSGFVQTLPQEMQSHIIRYGMRNSHHNTIAPTGTISLLANNISSGIEPIFAAYYQRKIKVNDQTTQTASIIDYACWQWQQQFQTDSLPDAWIDSQNLTPMQHLQMQAAAQAYVDNAISKTINLAEDFPFENLLDIYSQAHELGLKGATIYRPNPVTGSVLEVGCGA